MKTFNIKLITLALGFAFSAGAMAASMTKADYKASKDTISAEYKTGKAGCDSLTANAKDICRAEAKGKEQVARAKLEDNYKPTPKAQYKALVAASSADYAVSKEKCDDLSGDFKKTCVKDAKLVRTTADADAKVKTNTENYTLQKDS